MKPFGFTTVGADKYSNREYNCILHSNHDLHGHIVVCMSKDAGRYCWMVSYGSTNLVFQNRADAMKYCERFTIPSTKGRNKNSGTSKNVPGIKKDMYSPLYDIAEIGKRRIIW